MKQKLTSLFALMFLFAATALHAQSVEDGTPLITDASQLSSNASDTAEGQHIEYLVDGNPDTFWHTDWHNWCTDQYHYLQVELSEEFTGDIALMLQRRGGGSVNDHPLQFIVEGSADGSAWNNFGLVDVPYEGPGTWATTNFITITSASKYLRFSCTNTYGGYRTFWHCAEFRIYSMPHENVMGIALQNLLLKYDAYLWGETLNMGTGYGQYTDTQAEAAFMENLKKVDDICAKMDEEGYVMPSDEEVEALIKAVEDAYAAVLASEVLFTVEDGYYRIYTNLAYYKDVPVEEGSETTERQYVTKAMYSDLAGYGCWGTYDATDCRFVWKLTKDADDPTVVDMQNAATDYRLKDWASPMTMGEDGQLKVIFDWLGTENGHDVLYIRNSALARDPNSGNYIHQLSHGRGIGNGDRLCNWRGTFEMGDPYDSDKGTSEWYLEPVSEEEAQALIDAFALYKDHDLMVLSYKDMLAQAEDAVRKSQDASTMTSVDRDQPLITEVSQLSSPFTEQAEGALENLLDGDASTFWHSDWHGNFPDSPIHYLNIELKEAYQGSLDLYMARRNNAANDHPTKLQVDASNDGENWTGIAVITAPYDGQESTCNFSIFTLQEPYKYLRIGALDCAGSESGYRTFWHAGEIQLYPATIAGQTQFENMGEVATTLAALIEKGKATPDKDLTPDDYDALVAAYEAFTNALVDPTPLVNALNAAIAEMNIVQVGDAPGFWPDESVKEGPQALIDEIQKYTQGGKFDKATMDSYVEQLGKVRGELLAQANKVKTGKWYRIRHMNAEEYTLCNASITYANLNGQYIAVGHRVKETVNDAEVEVAYPYTTNETREGQNIYFFDEEKIQDMDAAMFRFVELPDGRYAIQNKASGLYLSRASEDAEVLLGFGPQSFEVSPIGYGQVLFIMKALDGSSYSRPNLNAHSNEYGSLLKWWSDTSYGCNSTFIVEEAEDVEEGFAPIVKKDMVLGQYYSMYFPESVQPSEGNMYEVIGTYTDEDKDFVALSEIDEVAQAGMPFVYIVGSPEDYNEEAPETVTVEFALGTEFTLEPGSKGGFTGVYSFRWVPEGSLVFSGNKVTYAEGVGNEDGAVYANMGYINFGEVAADPEEAGNYDLVMEVGGESTSMGEALITDVSQLSSNASDQLEGTNIGALIDGAPSTFWHTDWHGVCPDDFHYLQVELNEMFAGDITMVFTRRAGSVDDTPTQMKVWGSEDGVEFYEVTTLAMPFTGAGTTVVPNPFTVGPVKYLRFAASNTYSEGGWGYRKFWHCAEFQIYGINTYVDTSKADLLDVVFQDGTAYDQSPMKNEIVALGSPSVVFNETIGAEVFDMSGETVCGKPNAVFGLDVTDNMWNKMVDGYTCEVYVYPTFASASNWFSVLGYQQGGGPGLIEDSGKWSFEVHTGGSYHDAYAMEPVPNQWVHLVGVYDKDLNNGTALLYVDGQLAGQVDAPGQFDGPTGSAPRMFIGSDTSGDGTPEACFQGYIAFARIYSTVKTADQIAEMYKNASAVEGVAASKTVKSIFNLMGQKVEKAQKGIYIIDGKKVLVK